MEVLACAGDLEGPPPYHPSAIKQWASRVVSFSSQYNSNGWSADMTLGVPRVYPQHGDLHGAWATREIDKHQFIELEYDIPVTPTAIHIYETFNPGAVVAVKALDPAGKWIVLWSTNRPTRLSASRIFSPSLKETRLKFKQIRLELDCTAASTWCEIDAVQLVGIREGAVAPEDDSALVDSLKSMVNDKTFSDITFLVEGRPVYGHRGILAARSPYFRKVFKKNQKMTEITISGISQEDFIVTLAFLYTNRVPHDCSFKGLISLCSGSSIFDLPELKTAAMYKLLGMLTCENVIEAFQVVKDDKSLSDLKSLCSKFMADHVKKMLNVPSFQTLHQSDLIEVMRMATENLSMD